MKRRTRPGQGYEEKFTSDHEEQNMSQRRYKRTRRNKPSPSPSSTSRKELKKHSNPQRQGKPLVCQCDVFGPTANCRCNEDLEVIEEEQECEIMGRGSRQASFYSQITENEAGVRLLSQDHLTRSSSSEKRQPYPPDSDMSSKKPHHIPCSTCHCCMQCEEDDACSEFFEVLQSAMEVAIKKALDSMLGRYFSCLMKKIDNLTEVTGRNECFLAKMYSDLNDKISYYGERNAQQFQYLCMRMEHDRLFYQQQQEFFYKSRQKQPPTYESHIDCDDLREQQAHKGSEEPKRQGGTEGPEVIDGKNPPDTRSAPDEANKIIGEQQQSISKQKTTNIDTN